MCCLPGRRTVETVDTHSDRKISILEAIRRSGRNQAQVYRILVAGALDPDWSDRLGGLSIEAAAGDDSDEPVTALEGLIRDQAQLSGILNTLYELRYPLLNVEVLKQQIADPDTLNHTKGETT